MHGERGELVIDHTQGQGIDDKQGTKDKFSVAQCLHCQRFIALLYRPGQQILALANTDIARAAAVAPDLPSEYTHPYRCHACDANICRLCWMAMQVQGGTCPGPFRAQIERHIREKTSYEDPGALLFRLGLWKAG